MSAFDENPFAVRRQNKEILSDFTKISGLQLNCEKTEIMIVSYENLFPLKQFVSEVGFRNVDRICHLGIVFDNELKLLQNNWTDKLEKIKKLRNFFLCCNLTLVAKINIIKTFFLSQLCYLAPVVKPNHFFTDELKSIILRFLSSNRNIFPANRVFSPCASGGLGLQEPKHFIENLALKFAFRSFKSNQPWSAELKSFFLNIVLQV